MNEQVTAEEMRRLLRAYGVALEAADSLPPLVRIASRPRRWTVFEPLRRMPRLTIGTSTMVTYHVQRSTAALARRYARIAATRGLTEEDERASELVTTFRESLAEVRWRLVVPALLITALAAIQIAIGIVAPLVGRLPHVPKLSPLEQDELTSVLNRTTSSNLAPGAFGDLFSEIGKTGLPGLLTLAGTVIAAAYLVFRPLSPAFRVKRILFNLAPTGRIDLAHTTTTWNVARSGGLYDLERTLFARLGARPPNEINVDMWLGAAAAVGLAGFLSSVAVDMLADPGGRQAGVALLGAVVGLAVARIVSLWHTAKVRRRNIGLADPPGGFVAPFAERVVESRSVLETAFLGALLSLLALPLLSPIGVRLVWERRDLDRAYQRAQGSRGRLPSGRVWPAIGSATLLWLLPPVAVAVHLTRLLRLQPPGVGSARRTRAWLVPLAATPLVAFAVQNYDGLWVGIIMVAQCASFAVVFGAIQHEHNALVQHVGTPLPCDDPLWNPEQTAGHQGRPVVVPSQDPRSLLALPQPEG